LGNNGQEIKHALHGLLYNKEWTLAEEYLTENEAIVKLKKLYESDTNAYPFSFSVVITYQLSAIDNELKVHTEVCNKSDCSIPMAYGFHPYLKFNDSSIDDLTITFNASAKVILDDYAIPTGEVKKFNDYINPKKINKSEFDDCFQLNDNEGISTVIISDGESQIEFWQETGTSKYNYLQLYTPPHRKSIAVEPMSSSVDVFNNKMGLIEMLPNEKVTSSFGIKLV